MSKKINKDLIFIKLNPILSRKRQDVDKFAYDLRNYLEGVLNYMTAQNKNVLGVALTDTQVEFIMVLLKEVLL